MQYANVKAVPFVALVGENEMSAGMVTLKNMTTGEQQMVPAAELLSHL
jgi:histidyl-tRNA synthetase